MSDNIAGYIDRSYIKGQYYAYAAAPKPVVFKSNIDTISNELLTKAMFVTKGEASGTFPSDSGNSFLLTTVKYGESVYLQTAISVSTGYEYRRIYSGSWTSWNGADNRINTINTNVMNLNLKVEDDEKTVENLSKTVTNLGRDISSAKTTATNAYNAASNANSNVSALSTRISALGSRIEVVAHVTDANLASGGVTPAITVDISSYKFNQIYAIFPTTYRSGQGPGGSRPNFIPFIVEADGGTYDKDSFKYALFRPGSGSASADRIYSKFLILGK